MISEPAISMLRPCLTHDLERCTDQRADFSIRENLTLRCIDRTAGFDKNRFELQPITLFCDTDKIHVQAKSDQTAQIVVIGRA